MRKLKVGEAKIGQRVLVPDAPGAAGTGYITWVMQDHALPSRPRVCCVRLDDGTYAVRSERSLCVLEEEER